MLREKSVTSAVVGVRRWRRDYAGGLEKSSTGEVPRLQKFCRHNCWVFAALFKSKRQQTAESAECCRARDGSRRPSREAPARTATGEPRIPLWTWRALGWVANGVRVIPARYDHCVACRWSFVQWHSTETAANCAVECLAARWAANCSKRREINAAAAVFAASTVIVGGVAQW